MLRAPSRESLPPSSLRKECFTLPVAAASAEERFRSNCGELEALFRDLSGMLDVVSAGTPTSVSRTYTLTA